MALSELPSVLLSGIFPILHQAMHLSSVIHTAVACLSDHGRDLA